MKKSLRDWQRVCAIGLAVVMLTSSVLTPIAMAQVATTQKDRAQGLADGERDGKASTSAAGWILIGCFTGGFSWVYPEFFEVSVPQSRLIGKAPEYVAAYSDAYLAARKKTIQKNSCIGGGICLGACGLYYMLIIISAMASAD